MLKRGTLGLAIALCCALSYWAGMYAAWQRSIVREHTSIAALATLGLELNDVLKPCSEKAQQLSTRNLRFAVRNLETIEQSRHLGFFESLSAPVWAFELMAKEGKLVSTSREIQLRVDGVSQPAVSN
jgi:hypothetical protein